MALSSLRKQILSLFAILAFGVVSAQNPVVQFVLPPGNQLPVSEGIGVFGIAVEIANPNSNATSVDINVLPGGTATHGVNYTYGPVTVTFPANNSFVQIFDVTVIDDSTMDGNKSFTFKLANPTNNATIGADSEYVVTMINDDTSTFSLRVTSLLVPRDTGTIYLPVNLHIKSDSALQVQVNVIPAATTAVQGVNYLFNDTTLQWAIDSSGTVYVPLTIINDTSLEPNKVVTLGLSSPSGGAVLTDSILTLTILERHLASILQFNITSDTVEDPDSTVVFTPAYAIVNDPNQDTIYYDIDLDMVNSTAVRGGGPPADYDWGNQPLTIVGPTNGPDSFPISGFSLFNDPVISPTKTVILRLTNLSGNVVLGPDSVFTLYITNHNKLIASFLGAGQSYPKDTPMVEVPVVMSTFATVPVSVDVTLAPGSAVLGQDFTFDDSTVIFPPFSTDTQGVWVHIINNSLYQENKQINFNLSSPSNGVLLGITGYTLTIINDDSLSGISAPSEEGFDLYPNPAINSLNLRCGGGEAVLVIKDIIGQTVLTSGRLTEDLNTIDISMLPEGIYIASIETGRGTWSQRFVKISPN